MSRFIVRVVLYDSIYTIPRPNYEMLHEAMARRHFTRTIMGDDGILYNLPDGEYITQVGAGLHDVFLRARTACEEVWKDHGVFVNEVTPHTVFYNLKPHNAPPLPLGQKSILDALLAPPVRPLAPTAPLVPPQTPVKTRPAGTVPPPPVKPYENKPRPRS